MRAYLSVLRIRDYRLLWSGAVLSMLGDGATWTVLSWLALIGRGTGALGALTVCYTAPIILGGALVGPLLDRCSRRTVLVADSAIRAAVIASVPLADLFGQVTVTQLFLVAAIFGLLRIVPLGAVPTVVPELVPLNKLHTATALETIGYGLAGIVGPALGGLLIPVMGGPKVLLLVVASYLFFVLAVTAIRSPLSVPRRVASPVRATDGGWRPVLTMLRQDRVLLSITAGFALFNCAAGMVRVANPWLAQYKLPGGAHTLGLLLASYSGAQLVGSLIAGTLKPSDRQMRRIGILQIFAGGSLFLLLFDRLPFIVAGLILCGGFSSPMAVSSQVIRVMRIPTELRGRTMTLMRTLMNGAIPIGSLMAAPLLARGSYHLLVWLMTVTAAVPGLAIALSYRGMSFGAQVSGAPGPEPRPGNAEQAEIIDEAPSSVPIHAPAVD